MRRNTHRLQIWRAGLLLILIAAAGVFAANWLRDRSELQNVYDGKSLILVDCSDDSIFISKRETESRVPASLAKLFVIDYANEIADLNEIVHASPHALSMTKPGASTSGITEQEYYLHNLFAAMQVPSSNNAAYVVADYCGGILAPDASTSEKRVTAFMHGLQEHLTGIVCSDTVLYDPSGFDLEARTTVLDLKIVADRLLEKDWFRDTICQSRYTATLPDGSTWTWKNTNTFLGPDSEYYNENVRGIKTGSLSDDYNLIVLYRQHGKEFLICSLGSATTTSRYEDVSVILKTMDESNYLSGSGNGTADK